MPAKIVCRPTNLYTTVDLPYIIQLMHELFQFYQYFLDVDELRSRPSESFSCSPASIYYWMCWIYLLCQNRETNRGLSL